MYFVHFFRVLNYIAFRFINLVLIANMESDAPYLGKYIMSSRNRKMIVIEENVFRRRQRVLKNRSYWSCISGRQSGCKVKIHVLENGSDTPTIIKHVGQHNHDTGHGHVEAIRAANKLMREAKDRKEEVRKAAKTLISKEFLTVGNFKSSENMDNISKETMDNILEGLSSRPSAQIIQTKNYLEKPKSMLVSSPSTTDSSACDEMSTSMDSMQPMDTTSILQEIMASNVQSVYKPLQGKVALVTGASSGIGQAIAESIANAGAYVCIGARRPDRLTIIREKIRSNGGIVLQYNLDVSNRAQFQNVVQKIEEDIGHIDIVINNAGVMFYTHLHNAMMNDWDKMIDVNCRGVTNSIGCILPGMVERGKGHIVNISSNGAKSGLPGLGVYSATKFFIEGISQSLRQEVKDKGIRVSCIQPGDVKTEIGNYSRDHDAQVKYDSARTTEKILAPSDISSAVLYALTAPEHVGVNEILIEPKENPL